jgi:predicted transposase YdaD
MFDDDRSASPVSPVPRRCRRRPPGLDEPLKVLFREHAAELLDLVGEKGASLRSTRVLELNTLTRRLDCLLELERGGVRHYRVVEFEARLRRRSLARFHLYSALLMAQTGCAVQTTVVALEPPAPANDALVLRVRVGGRTANRWRFDLVRLWTLDAALAFERDTPGLLGLVPLLRGGRELGTIARASERLAAGDPPHGLSEAHTALFVRAGRYYTVSELARVMGREKLMQSSIWREARAEGRQEGLEQGLAQGLQHERKLCRAMVARFHPELLGRASAVIDACADREHLERWILEAPV